MLGIQRLSWLRQVLGLGALSALLTLCAGGVALLALSHTVQVAHELGELIQVQRFHQDATQTGSWLFCIRDTLNCPQTSTWPFVSPLT